MTSHSLGSPRRLLLDTPRCFLVILMVALLGPGLHSQARAEVHGGIEIGAKGVKATVLDVTDGPDGYEAKVLMSATRNTALTAGLASAGRFEAGALKETSAAVAHFAEQMRKEHKVPDSRIYVVGSSGLFSALEPQTTDIVANQALLAAAVKEASGLPIRFITVQREIELSIAGIVPARRAADSLLLDIGGGNTKGGYCEAGKECVTVSIPYGSVTFADLVMKRAEKGKYAETAEALRADVLVPALRKGIDKRPELLERKRIYLSGGAVWALASFIRPSDRRSYVALTAADIAAYRKLLLETPDAFPKVDLSTIENPKVREAAYKEIERVKKVYQPRQLLAGAEILQALSSEFHFDREKKLSFARNAPTAWILAYVAEKAAAPRSGPRR
jgi:exopolyphosphatase/pppGpp-phosphohydrolase